MLKTFLISWCHPQSFSCSSSREHSLGCPLLKEFWDQQMIEKLGSVYQIQSPPRPSYLFNELTNSSVTVQRVKCPKKIKASLDQGAINRQLLWLGHKVTQGFKELMSQPPSACLFNDRNLCRPNARKIPPLKIFLSYARFYIKHAKTATSSESKYHQYACSLN